MIKTYVPYEPDQQLLLPAALQEWLPDDHWPTSYPMWWTSWTCRRSPLATSGNGAAGRRNPRMMVKVLLYGYCVGVASSRRIAQRLHEDIAFRVLAANNTPDFRTISDFRK